MVWTWWLLACGGGEAVVVEAPPPADERWPGGAPRSEGRTEGGRREGTWTAWREDGAFASRTDWVGGVQHGLRQEVGADGRIVELVLERGVVVSFRTLPAGTPMPEWDGDRRVSGARYASPPEVTTTP